MSRVKSAGGADAGIGGADGGWPTGIRICEDNPQRSAREAEVIAVSCANRLRVSNTRLLVLINFR